MSQDYNWAGNSIIRATSDALNVEIHIMSSVRETPTNTFKPTTDDSVIFLGHAADHHYVSTRNLSESQVMLYGGCTTDGLDLLRPI